MGKEKITKKKKIKKQAIFNLISIVIVLSVGFYYLGRLIYYKIDSEKEKELSNILVDRLKEEASSPYLSKKFLLENNGVWQYVGNINNNFVSFKGFLWRIVKINKDDSITMISEDIVTSLTYNNIYSWLNTNSDDKYSGIFEKSLNTDKLLNTSQCTDTFDDIEKSTCNVEDNKYKIGLLSINDYKFASANDSYLNNGTAFWTTNNADKENAWAITSEGLIENASLNSKIGIRPTITVSGKIEIINGNGTADDPYVIENKNVKSLKDSNVGEYVNFNNILWRIIAVNNNSIKIASDECIKDKNGECLKMQYSNFSNEFDETDDENLLYYLNNTYYNSIKNKKMILSGNFYSGTYSLENNDYRSCMKEVKKLKVGFLSVSDIFAFDVADTFLLTTSPDNEFSIYSVKDDHTLYENSITEEMSIRPAIYLKGDLNIIGGTGTYLDPYKIEGDFNE